MSIPPLIQNLINIVDQMIQNGEEISDSEQKELINIFSSFKQSQDKMFNQASELWSLAGGNAQAFSNYLSNFPDARLNSISKNPEELNNLINQFESQVSMPSGEVSDGIPKAELNSSNVYGFAYNPRNQQLFIKFNGKDNRENGPIYEYEGVPGQIFNLFKKGAIPAKTDGSNQFGVWWRGKRPSLGASMFELIKKGAFPYQKVA